MKKSLLVMMFLFISTGIALGQLPTFSVHTLSTSLIKAAAADIADFNNDGRNDIVAGTSDEQGEISLWTNNGEQGFTKTIIESEYPGARHLLAVDLNKDSNVDIVSVSYYSNEIVWLMNDGGANFQKIILANNFSNPHTVDVKDLNNDGYLDIMSCGAGLDGSRKEIAWWKNDGAQNFEKHLLTDRFTKSCFIEGGDINGDGNLDILASDEDSGEIVWFMNDGNENFTEHSVDQNYTRAHTVFARDIDLDGDMDIIGNATSVSNLSWWENDGAQNFTRHHIRNLLGAIWADIIDLDNDGDMDLYCAAMGDQSISIWENDGSQNFTKHLLTGSCAGGFGVVAGDLDNDSDTDFVAVGYTSNRLVWWENNLVTDIAQNNYEMLNDFMLHQNYPNPFNPSTQISYSLASAGNVSLIIYDINGNEIKTLIDDFQTAGENSITWNGENNFGQSVVSGMYMYRLAKNSNTISKKMILLK